MLHSLMMMKRYLVEYFKGNHLSLTHRIVLLVCDLVQPRDLLFGANIPVACSKLCLFVYFSCSSSACELSCFCDEFVGYVVE